MNLSQLKSALLKNQDAKAAYLEARYRRRISERVEDLMVKRGMTIPQFQEKMGVGQTQLRRLLNQERGGALSFLTVMKAAIVLDTCIEDLISRDFPKEK